MSGSRLDAQVIRDLKKQRKRTNHKVLGGGWERIKIRLRGADRRLPNTLADADSSRRPFGGKQTPGGGF